MLGLDVFGTSFFSVIKALSFAMLSHVKGRSMVLFCWFLTEEKKQVDLRDLKREDLVRIFSLSTLYFSAFLQIAYYLFATSYTSEQREVLTVGKKKNSE